MRAFLLALVLAGCASAGPNGASSTSPAPIVAAEKAFAARAAAIGWISSFKEYAASDALMYAPTPTNAQAFLATQADDGDKTLAWTPRFVGIAASGDFGFSAGPVWAAGKPYGNYFTIWRKQPDGKWKWIFDGGGGLPSEWPAAYGDAPRPEGRRASVTIAEQEVSAAEDDLATAAETDTSLAFALRILKGTILLRGGVSPAPALDADQSVILQKAPKAVRFKRLGMMAAPSADMVFTYGEASWDEDGAARLGRYARVWQTFGTQGRIVYDQVIPARKPT